ncbi:MAG TPA: hypothetical protein VFI22_19105 [Thermomicrobiales bacterium]|nr:hypothetical protein [Thermomicrobiales bacterium]
MRRLVAVGALLVMVVVAAPAAGQTPGIPAEGAVSTAGIGLAQNAWTAAHGPGNYGQNYVIFENGRYFVQFRDGVTSYIEYGWDKPGILFTEAQDAARTFLPSDARLTESYELPPTGAGPIGIFVERYDSPALTALSPSWGTTPWNGVLIAYFQTPSPDSIHLNVTRVSIAAGVPS